MGTIIIFKLWRSMTTIHLFGIVPLQLYVAHTNTTEYASDRIGPSSRHMRRLRILVRTPMPTGQVNKVHDKLVPSIFLQASLPLLPPFSVGFEHARVRCRNCLRHGVNSPPPPPSLPTPPQPWPWPSRLQALQTLLQKLINNNIFRSSEAGTKNNRLC
jgi:hypothetical protein